MKKISFVSFILMYCLSSAAWADPYTLSDVNKGPTLYKMSAFNTSYVRNGGNVGHEFKIGSVSRTVDALGVIDLDTDGLATSHQVGLWRKTSDTTGELIAEVNVPAGTAGQRIDGWRYAKIVGGPVTLNADTFYVLSARMYGSSTDDQHPAGQFPAMNTFFLGSNEDLSQCRWLGGDFAFPSGFYGWMGSAYGAANLGTNMYLAGHDLVPGWNATNVGAASGITVDVTLNWTTGRNPDDMNVANPLITKHFVYISTDPNNFVGATPVEVSAGSPTQETGSYIKTDLNSVTVYYWRVDESISDSEPNAAQTIVSGTVGKFTTRASNPVILTQPADVLTTVGGTADYSIGVIAEAGLHYQWKKSNDNIADACDSLIGGDSNSVTLTNVQLSDAGKYIYCVVSKTGGSTTSNLVFLEVQRQMAWWKLNDNLNDTMGNWNGAILAGGSAINYAVGKDANSAVFTNDIDNNRIKITNSENAFNNYKLGLTVNTWIKGTDTTWSGIIGKQFRTSDGDTTGATGWVLEVRGSAETDAPIGSASFVIRGLQTLGSLPVVVDSNWHMVTATFNGATKEAKLYIDGELENSMTMTGSGPYDCNEAVYIGSEFADHANVYQPFGGNVDDVRIFNYPVSDKAVLDMFNEFTDPDKVLCISTYASNLDVNKDCKVDFADLAELVSGWLSCGLYPNCNL